MFNLGDQEGDASYSADFVMTLVPSKADVDEPAANEPAADTSAALPSGADTGATSPKTGMDAGALKIEPHAAPDADVGHVAPGVLAGARHVGRACRKVRPPGRRKAAA